jgi:predicted phosphodiesterase
MSIVRFLVASDLHASVNDDEREDSRLIFINGECELAETFIEYTKGLNKEIDYLICPGDISNKGNSDSFKAGWDFLNRAKIDLEIPKLICVPGNHDHQSLPGISFSTNHLIKFCSPPFPNDDFDKNTQFWAWHWCHLQEEHFNVIMLNSSAYHGNNDEYKHGRIPPESISQIEGYINSEKFSDKSYNLLLCHHHPIKMEQVDHTDNEVMEGGQLLLKTLEGADVGPWFIIHGHKHFASLQYAAASSMFPSTVLSAGSLGANLYPEIKDRTSNQFYIIDINIDKTVESERLVGTFETHSWELGSGWSLSNGHNLPAKGGFGSNITPKTIINDIEVLLKVSPVLDKKDLEPIHDQIENYTPIDFQKLINKLEQSGFSLEHKNGELIEVAKSC